MAVRRLPLHGEGCVDHPMAGYISVVVTQYLDVHFTDTFSSALMALRIDVDDELLVLTVAHSRLWIDFKH